jgi:septal ring factor EnvC (AmiA/AmiB activator)
MLLFASIPNVYAENTSPQIHISEQQSQARRLQKGIKEHEEKIKESQEKGLGLLAELERIDQNLQIQDRKLAVLKESYIKQEAVLDKQIEHLEKILAEKNAQQQYVQERLTAYYQMGGIGLMNVVFSKTNLAELMSFQEYFHHLLQYDRLAIASYQEKITKLIQAQKKHEIEKDRLLELVDKVEAKENDLTAAKNDKKMLLSRVKTEEKLYQQAMDEIEKAAQNLAATLNDFEKQRHKPPVLRSESTKKKVVSEQPLPTVDEDSFLARKGKLTLPCEGLVTPVKGGSGTGSSETIGIDISTENNQKIHAIFDGTVIASGYLRGYGNMIIIDHGQHYYTIVSRAGEIAKEEGTTVQEGEIIGITGDSQTLLSEGLHFEIRQGSTPQDPFLWLDTENIILKK